MIRLPACMSVSLLLAALLACGVPTGAAQAASLGTDGPEVRPVTQPMKMPAELSRLLRNLKDARGFSAAFRQTLQFSDGSKQTYRGELEVLPPGRFRWRYTEPYEQLFISDGFTIWHYEPDLMQVTVLREMRDVDPTVMQLLGGRLGLQDVHLLEVKPSEHRYHVRLGADTQVWISVRDGLLDYIEGRDTLGNTNRISLTDMRLSAPDAGRFAFVVPEGVDVVPLH